MILQVGRVPDPNDPNAHETIYRIGLVWTFYTLVDAREKSEPCSTLCEC